MKLVAANQVNTMILMVFFVFIWFIAFLIQQQLVCYFTDPWFGPYSAPASGLVHYWQTQQIVVVVYFTITKEFIN